VLHPHLPCRGLRLPPLSSRRGPVTATAAAAVAGAAGAAATAHNARHLTCHAAAAGAVATAHNACNTLTCHVRVRRCLLYQVDAGQSQPLLLLLLLLLVLQHTMRVTPSPAMSGSEVASSFK
jgi:hypothetical protein